MTEMALLLCCSWAVLLYSYVQAYENLALLKPAWQSSTFWSDTADRAVDGLYTDLSEDGGQCAASNLGQKTAEWRVDLGHVHSIHHIAIHYMPDSTTWDKKMVLDSSAWDSLCISLTLLTKRAECCVLGTPTSPEPPYLILSTSPVLTTGDTSSTITTGLILRILRGIPFMLVMIYVKLKFMVRVLDVLINTLGCPSPGYYGGNCSLECPQNCQDGYCDIVEGTCFGCKHRHIGSRCTQECPEGQYGSKCLQNCSMTCGDPERCDIMTGHCKGGCQVGWTGSMRDFSAFKSRYKSEIAAQGAEQDAEEFKEAAANSANRNCFVGRRPT
ncbi:uncharacterized protein LOC144624461 [Crassostrea virginica]